MNPLTVLLAAIVGLPVGYGVGALLGALRRRRDMVRRIRERGGL